MSKVQRGYWPATIANATWIQSEKSAPPACQDASANSSAVSDSSVSSAADNSPAHASVISALRKPKHEHSRAFYCFMVGKRVVVLHAFIKKTQETPVRELKLARKRLKELQDG